jgi:hypothetical protein
MSASKKDCRARADNGKDPIKSKLFDPVSQFGDSAHRSSFPSIISKETATRSYQRNFFQKTTADLPPSRGARKAVTFICSGKGRCFTRRILPLLLLESN